MMLQVLAYLIRNPLTSSAGVGLLLANLGPILTMAGNGATFSAIVSDSHFSALLAAFAALSAKDVNVTGGTKQNY